ncbi:MAG: hypothetical protein LBE38_04180 [Deltaproteobacteria bacterium]|jgi:hypothetical protein|nr:hypothetical protein [Deltaproteobacteria bacterium]
MSKKLGIIVVSFIFFLVWALSETEEPLTGAMFLNQGEWSWHDSSQSFEPYQNLLMSSKTYPFEKNLFSLVFYDKPKAFEMVSLRGYQNLASAQWSSFASLSSTLALQYG